MNFKNIGAGYLTLGNETTPVVITKIRTVFGEAPEFTGHVCDLGYARGGVIPVEKSPIKNVIFNDPATIVYWNDGTKTVVKCQPGDIYSKETGLALCIAKKYLGNKGNFNKVFKKWIPEETEPVEEKVLMSFQEDAVTGAINLLRCGEISIGDKVVVVNPGQRYPDYRDWVELHVTNPEDVSKWEKGGIGLLHVGDIGVVKYLASHKCPHNGVIAYIEVDNKCHMINVEGLKRIREV